MGKRLHPATWSRVLLAVVLCWSSSLFAHPWGGLVVDDEGNIYYSFVCPVESDRHVACVYRLDRDGGKPQPVLIATSDPSDLVLTRTPSRDIYAAERVGSQPFRTRLWKLSADDKPTLVIPFSPPQIFSADPLAVSDSGQVYFGYEGRIVAYDDTGLTASLDASLQAGDIAVDSRSIRLLQVVDDDGLLLVNREALVSLAKEKTAVVLAESLRETSPPDLPFSGGNILFDMATDGEAVLLAYYGNREVLRVLPDGTKTSLLKADEPWSPHGVDVYDGRVYVLESTTPRPAWKFWQPDSLVPRIRVIDEDGDVGVLYEYKPGAE